MCARKYSQAYKQLSIQHEIARLISYNIEVAVCSRKHSTISKTLTYPNKPSLWKPKAQAAVSSKCTAVGTFLHKILFASMLLRLTAALKAHTQLQGGSSCP